MSMLQRHILAKNLATLQSIKTKINMMTKENYESTVIELKSLLKNQRCLRETVEFVYEKAVEEPEKTSLLAAMSEELSTVKVPVENPGTRTHLVYSTLKSLMITKCRDQFMVKNAEEEPKLESDPAKDSDDKATSPIDQKRRKLMEKKVANVKFIGDLYMHNMLTRSIMVNCINYLLDKKQDQTLECLCQLLSTTGERLLSESTEPIDFIFEKMQNIIECSETTIRDHVKLQMTEVLELKKTWPVPKRLDSPTKQLQTQLEINTEKLSNQRRGFPSRRDKRNIEKRCARRQCYNLTYSSRIPRPSYAVIIPSKNKRITPNTSNISNVESAPVAESSGISNIVPLTTDPNLPIKGEPVPSTSAAIELTDIGKSPEILPFETLPEYKRKILKSAIDAYIVNLLDKEIVDKLKGIIDEGLCAPLVTEIIDIALENTLDIRHAMASNQSVTGNYKLKLTNSAGTHLHAVSSSPTLVLSKLVLYLVTNNIITKEDFVLGVKDIFKYAADLINEIPMVYLYLGKFVAPQIGKKFVDFKQVFEMSKNIITANQGPVLLQAILIDLKDSKGASFLKSAWKASGIELEEWMDPEQIDEWLYMNELDFLVRA